MHIVTGGLVAAAFAVSACGRFGFEPVGGIVGDPSDAAKPTGDGASTTGGDGGLRVPDAASTACSYAIPVVANQPYTTSTCGGHDLIAGCGPSGTQEVVFAFTPPDGNGYTFRAFDHGTQNVSNSTGYTDPACTAVQGCSGILGMDPGAGNTIYLVVEASAGGCAQIDFSVQ